MTASLHRTGTIYQIGKLPDGRTFLAMKLIKGRPIDSLLKDHDGTNFVAVFNSCFTHDLSN